MPDTSRFFLIIQIDKYKIGETKSTMKVIVKKIYTNWYRQLDVIGLLYRYKQKGSFINDSRS